MISRVRYTLREMWASLTRNLTLTVAAVITSMVSLFLFGMTLLIQQAFDNQLSQWTGGVKMIVYVKNGAEQDSIDRIQQALESRPEIIRNVEYCSIECSLGQAQKLFALLKTFRKNWRNSTRFYRITTSAISHSSSRARIRGQSSSCSP